MYAPWGKSVSNHGCSVWDASAILGVTKNRWLGTRPRSRVHLDSGIRSVSTCNVCDGGQGHLYRSSAFKATPSAMGKAGELRGHSTPPDTTGRCRSTPGEPLATCARTSAVLPEGFERFRPLCLPPAPVQQRIMGSPSGNPTESPFELVPPFRIALCFSLIGSPSTGPF